MQPAPPPRIAAMPGLPEAWRPDRKMAPKQISALPQRFRRSKRAWQICSPGRLGGSHNRDPLKKHFRYVLPAGETRRRQASASLAGYLRPMTAALLQQAFLGSEPMIHHAGEPRPDGERSHSIPTARSL